jgi:peptidoglycan hydrolase-like protein with peptidoglycan-binding domain
MRRLWMSLLLVPVLAFAVPTAALASSSAPTVTAARTSVLQLGMKGSAIKTLQRRLAALKYYPGSIDGQFGTSTLEAVWAFQEVQGLPGHDYVSAAMQRALANPKAPKVLDRAAGANRIEVNLASEVLVLYRGNSIQLISHVSSGGGYYFCSPGGGCGYAITPTGNFKTIVFMPGWVQVPLGEMYNPVFFIGTVYAIHGEPTYGPTGGGVPVNPVSHGCVRIPYDIAQFFHTLVRTVGTPVYVYS